MAPIPPWSDLPPELISAIANFLTPNPIDLVRFRAVCKSWVSSLILSPPSPNILSSHFPLQIPFPPNPLRSGYVSSHECYILSATSVFAIHPPNELQFPDSDSGSSSGLGLEASSTNSPNTWVAFVDEFNPGTLTIRKPFTRNVFDKPLDFPKKLNILNDFRGSEIGRYCNLNVVVNRNGRFVKTNGYSRHVVNKVVLLSDGLANMFIVVLFSEGKLGLLKLEARTSFLDTDWQVIHDGKGFRFDDIVEYKGRLLGIDRRGRVYRIRYSNLIEMKGIVAPITGGGGRRKRMIESLGLLYLVVRWNDRKATSEKFKVYVLNEEIRKWVEVTSIGDRIFFFGRDCSFFASPKEFEGSIGRDCIIFSENSFASYEGGYGDSSLFRRTRLYDLHVGVYHLEDDTSMRAIETYPGHSDLFWPHPDWFWLNSKLKLLGTLETTTDRVLARTCDENLKAKFKSLSPIIEAIVSGDISQEDVFNMLKQADTVSGFLDSLVKEIEKDSKEIMMNIAENGQPHSESVNRQNEEGTVTLGAEERNGCVDTVQKATQCSNSEVDWHSSEVNRRLGTHIELKVLLVGVMRVIKKSGKVKAFMESKEEAPTSGNEKKR